MRCCGLVPGRTYARLPITDVFGYASIIIEEAAFLSGLKAGSPRRDSDDLAR